MQIDDIKSFLEEAKKTSQLPPEDTESIDINLELEVIGFIRGVAAAWHCTPNDVLVATLMAIVDKKPQSLDDLIK
jgi:hypothetical protein